MSEVRTSCQQGICKKATASAKPDSYFDHGLLRDGFTLHQKEISLRITQRAILQWFMVTSSKTLVHSTDIYS